MRLASELIIEESHVGLTYENSEYLLDRWDSFTQAEIHNFGHKSQQIAFFDTLCRHYSILSLVWNLPQDSLRWQRILHYLETSIATLSRSQQRRKIQSFHFLAIFRAYSRPFVGFAILYHPETIRDRRNVQTPQLHRQLSARDAWAAVTIIILFATRKLISSVLLLLYHV